MSKASTRPSYRPVLTTPMPARAFQHTRT